MSLWQGVLLSGCVLSGLLWSVTSQELIFIPLSIRTEGKTEDAYSFLCAKTYWYISVRYEMLRGSKTKCQVYSWALHLRMWCSAKRGNRSLETSPCRTLLNRILTWLLVENRQSHYPPTWGIREQNLWQLECGYRATHAYIIVLNIFIHFSLLK